MVRNALMLSNYKLIPHSHQQNMFSKPGFNQMKISDRKLKTESLIVLKNSPTILFNVLNLRPTNIFSSGFHVENKSRQCLTKQL